MAEPRRSPYAGFPGRVASAGGPGGRITVVAPVFGHHPRLPFEPDAVECVQ